jgi:uncharacterized protein
VLPPASEADVYLTKRFQTFAAGDAAAIVCNALTGEISVFRGPALDALEALREERMPDCGGALLEQLRDRRFLFESREQEDAYFRDLCESAWDSFRRESPQHYTFVVTTLCNFNCPYCFEDESLRTRTQTLSEVQVAAAFETMDETAARTGDARPPEVEIFGGEPLLPRARPVVEYLVACLAERGGRASLQTNGYHLAGCIALLQRYPEQFRQLQVTLDGPREIHDRRRILWGGQPTFDRIVGAIDDVARLDLPLSVNVRMNVDRENVDALEAMADVYAAHGWTQDPRFSFVAAPVDNRSGILSDPGLLVTWDELFRRLLPLSVDTGGGPFDLSVFKAAGYFRHYLGTAPANGDPGPFAPRVSYCEAVALKLFVFHPDGRIYPCPETVGRPEFAIGTYFPRRRFDADACAQWTSQTILNRQQCRECAISTFCGGGCVLAALHENGTMAVPACERCSHVLDAFFGQFTGRL